MTYKHQAQFKLRMPDDVKGFLAEQAQRNERTITKEIIFTIRERMARETKTASESGATLPKASPGA